MNNVFNVEFDELTGGLAALRCVDDKDNMNWVDSPICFGSVKDGELTDFKCDGNRAEAVYRTKNTVVHVERENCGEYYKERYVYTNSTDCDIFLIKGEAGIFASFADRYTAADICMTQRCNCHIWCGENTAYICALKMGESDVNLGLVLTEGCIDKYSIRFVGEKSSNDRGCIVMNPAYTHLAPGESMTVAWEIFEHSGMDDFYDKLKKYPNAVVVEAENYTVFHGEKIRFRINAKEKTEVFLNGEPIPVENNEVCYMPQRTGEHVFSIISGNNRTNAKFHVSVPLWKLAESRVNFIADKQQYNNPESCLDGAYLIYDNEDEYVLFNNNNGDHNASRERVGMGLLIARYLRHNPNEKLMKSLMKYITFLRREIIDEETGYVCDTVHLSKKFKRLYNGPWVSELMVEVYWLTLDKEYLNIMLKIEKWFYENGGARFYPNGIFPKETIDVLENAGMIEEKNELAKLYKNHIDNMIDISVKYPKSEVDYEQTMVVASVTHLTHLYMMTGDKKYMDNIDPHMRNLERFNGQQPDYRLCEVAIRHWDDYWFGKRRLFGDTFPHYWSALTSAAFIEYYQCTKDEKYLKAGVMGLRNCLCLFKEDGKASCAYVYPYKLDNEAGEFYDEWANDQDFALYYALKYSDYLG